MKRFLVDYKTNNPVKNTPMQSRKIIYAKSPTDAVKAFLNQTGLDQEDIVTVWQEALTTVVTKRVTRSLRKPDQSD